MRKIKRKKRRKSSGGEERRGREGMAAMAIVRKESCE